MGADSRASSSGPIQVVTVKVSPISSAAPKYVRIILPGGCVSPGCGEVLDHVSAASAATGVTAGSAPAS